MIVVCNDHIMRCVYHIFVRSIFFLSEIVVPAFLRSPFTYFVSWISPYHHISSPAAVFFIHVTFFCCIPMQKPVGAVDGSESVGFSGGNNRR